MSEGLTKFFDGIQSIYERVLTSSLLVLSEDPAKIRALDGRLPMASAPCFPRYPFNRKVLLWLIMCISLIRCRNILIHLYFPPSSQIIVGRTSTADSIQNNNIGIG